MTDFSTIPTRANDQVITASWFNTIRAKLLELGTYPSLASYSSDGSFVAAKGSAASDSDYYYNTTDKTIHLYAGSAWRSISSLNQILTLTNKTFDDELRVKELSSTTTPPSGYQKLYPKIDGKWYSKDDAGTETEVGSGAGAGSGNVNFLSEKTISDYSTYADAYSDTPEDGVGGSNASISIIKDTITPINGSADALNLKMRVDYNDCKGCGVSVNFSTRGKIDRAKPIVIEINSLSSGNYADNDFGVFVYDVTNARLIHTVQRDILASSLVSTQIFEFQTSSDSDSYRLILHVRSANTNPIMYFTISCGPAQVIKGPVSVYLGALATTSSWSTNTTHSGQYWRENEFLVGRVLLTLTGAPTSANLAINLPSGLSMDTTKVISVAGGIIEGGSGRINDATGSAYPLFGTLKDATSMYLTYSDDAATGVVALLTTQAAPITFATGDTISFNYKVPIQGWSSSQVLSSDSGARQIYAYNNKGTATGSISAVESTIVFPAMTKDKTASYNATTGEYILPESGAYFVASTVETSGTYALNTDDTIYVQCAGTSIFGIGKRSDSASGRKCYSGSGMFEGVKGDVVRVRITSAGTGVTYGAALAGNMFSIFKIQSPQQIAASEKCCAVYTTNTAVTCTNITRTTIPFEDRVQDTSGSYNTSTGIYTCGKAGDLNLQCLIGLASNAGWAVGERAILFANIGGVEMDINKKYMEATVNPYSFYLGGSVLSYPVSKGTQVYVQVYQESGGNIALDTNTGSNRLSISIT